MRHPDLSRRRFLRGAGAALALPFLEALHPRPLLASPATPPIRMGCLYLPNGVPMDAWLPRTSGGRIEKLNDWMSPLEPYRAKLQFLVGLGSETKGSHPGAAATWLVRPCPEGDSISRRRGVGEPSMDQIVARSVGSETPFASLELISRPEGSHSKSILRNNISWRNGSTPVPRESSPRAVFDRLTGSEQSSREELDQRRSVLDAVLADARSLRPRVSRSDLYKLDEYLDSVRDVEKRMGEVAAGRRRDALVAARSFPAPPDAIPEDHAAYLRLLFDMMLLAFWSDSTRVATFMLDHEQSNRYFDFIPGVKGMWHAISHWRDISGQTEDDDGETSWSSPEAKYSQYLEITKYHHEQVAYFLRRMDGIQEGEGTLLDSSLILYGSPFSDGHEHLSKDLPMLLAGTGGGRLEPGRVLEHPGAPAEGVYLSMMDLMGVPVHRIGGVDTAVAIN